MFSSFSESDVKKLIIQKRSKNSLFTVTILYTKEQNCSESKTYLHYRTVFYVGFHQSHSLSLSLPSSVAFYVFYVLRNRNNKINNLLNFLFATK